MCVYVCVCVIKHYAIVDYVVDKYKKTSKLLELEPIKMVQFFLFWFNSYSNELTCWHERLTKRLDNPINF